MCYSTNNFQEEGETTKQEIFLIQRKMNYQIEGSTEVLDVNVATVQTSLTNDNKKLPGAFPEEES